MTDYEGLTSEFVLEHLKDTVEDTFIQNFKYKL